MGRTGGRRKRAAATLVAVVVAVTAALPSALAEPSADAVPATSAAKAAAKTVLKIKVTGAAGPVVGYADVSRWKHSPPLGKKGWVFVKTFQVRGNRTLTMRAVPGRYRVHVVDESGLNVPVWYPGRSDHKRAGEVTVRKGRTKKISMTLPRAGAGAGRVVGPTGNPVSSVEIHAQVRQASGAWRTLPRQYWNNPDGTFVVDGLAPGVHRLRLEHGSHLTRTSPAFTVRRGRTTRLPELALAVGSWVSGTVRAAEGETFAGEVHVFRRGTKKVGGKSVVTYTQVGNHIVDQDHPGWHVGGLRAGQHVACFGSYFVPAQNWCHRSAATKEKATLLSFDGRNARAGIDISVQKAS